MKYEKSTSYYGMEYLTVYFKIDRVHPKHGPLISAETLRSAEMTVAAELIKRRVPIRGVELRFLRKALCLSYRDLGQMLSLSHMAISKWEKKKQRLEPINEACVRALFAQLLKVEMPGWFDSLKGTEKAPAKFEVRAA